MEGIRNSHRARQDQHQDDRRNGAESAGGSKTPIPAVGPRGQSTEQQDDEEDEEDGTEHGGGLAWLR